MKLPTTHLLTFTDRSRDFFYFFSDFCHGLMDLFHYVVTLWCTSNVSHTSMIHVTAFTCQVFLHVVYTRCRKTNNRLAVLFLD